MTLEIARIEELISEVDKQVFCDKRCCYGTCENSPITSHTISENYLYKLHNDLKEVLTFEPAMSVIVNKQSPKLIKKIHKKRFSTFMGFCNDHDHKLFEPIDSFDGEINKEKATLVHYRIICYGINHIKTQQLRLQHMATQNYLSSDLESADDNQILNLMRNGQLSKRLDYCLLQHILRKKQLERMIKSGNFDEIDFRVLHGDLNNPIFFGRSSYLLHKNHGLFKFPGYSFMPWITYMTLLTDKTNDLIFCWLKSDEIYSKRLKMLLKREVPKKIIEVLAYGCSDSFAVEKNFYTTHFSTIEEIIKKFRVY